jgi:hypothetical protein
MSESQPQQSLECHRKIELVGEYCSTSNLHRILHRSFLCLKQWNILSRMKFCEKKGDDFIDLDRRIRMIDT